MNTLELYLGATFLRGALAVLLLLGAERLLRHRLGAECRRFLWLVCLVLLVIPQMNFSVLPVKLDLSGAAAPVKRAAKSGSAKPHGRIAPAELRERATPRAVWRFLVFHRRKIEAAALAGLPLPALLLLLCRYLRCRRQIRRLPPVTDRRVLETWKRILTEAGPLRRPAVLLDSSVIGLGPTLFGCFRRKLLLPADRLEALSDTELCLLLEHEYNHCRAGDAFLNMLALVLWAFCWYNPFMLVARRRVRSCSEFECDRRVLRRHPHAVREYGNLLLKFASVPSGTAVTIGLAESPRELSRRIRGMTAGAPTRRTRLFSRGITVCLAAMIAAPAFLVAVNARPVRKPRAAAQIQQKPLLPHLTVKAVPDYAGDGTPVPCWELDYSEPFPYGKSELVLESGGIRHRIGLMQKPEYLRLRAGEDGGLHPETSDLPPAAVPGVSAAEKVTVPADRKPVYASAAGSSLPAAFTLEVAGLDRENLNGFRRP